MVTVAGPWWALRARTARVYRDARLASGGRLYRARP